MAVCLRSEPEIHGNFEAHCSRATISASARGLVLSRGPNRSDKDILDAGFHPRGVFHRHRHSQVGALTVGYLFNFLETKVGTVSAQAPTSRATQCPENSAGFLRLAIFLSRVRSLLASQGERGPRIRDVDRDRGSRSVHPTPDP